MTDDIKALRDILPRVGEPEGTFCCVEGGLLRRLLDRMEAAESALKKANATAEHFEREWYLRTDELEAAERDAKRYRGIRRFLVTGSHLDTGKIAFTGDNEGLDEVVDISIGVRP